MCSCRFDNFHSFRVDITSRARGLGGSGGGWEKCRANADNRRERQPTPNWEGHTRSSFKMPTLQQTACNLELKERRKYCEELRFKCEDGLEGWSGGVIS